MHLLSLWLFPLALLLSLFLPRTLATLANPSIPRPTCLPSSPARRIEAQSCINDLLAHKTDVITISGPAGGKDSHKQICLRGSLGVAWTGIVVTRASPSSDETFSTTKGDVACGAQAVIDSCSSWGGLLTGGIGGVCGTEDVLVCVDGSGNKMGI